jgi:hypothetical protein
MTTTTPTTPKLGIAIDLDQLGGMVREYLAQLAPRDRLEAQLRFSHFLMWARRRRESGSVIDGNVLTFRIEKEVNR